MPEKAIADLQETAQHDLDEDLCCINVYGLPGSDKDCFNGWDDEEIYEHNENWQMVLDQEYEEDKALCGLC
jgi:hypothetical protein